MPAIPRRRSCPLQGPEGLEPRRTLAVDGFAVSSAPPLLLASAAQDGPPTVTVRTSAGEWTNAFALQGLGTNPFLVRVAFDPQPEPPGQTAVSLATATLPRFTTVAAASTFRVLVSVSRGAAPLVLDPPVLDQAKGVVRLVVRDAGGRPACRISLTVRDVANGSLAPGSLVGLNPQPEPPGDARAVAYGFAGSFATAVRAGLAVAVSDAQNKPVAFALRPEVPIKAGQTVPVFFTLSKESTTFTASDVLVTGGGLSQFTGSGVAYSALFTPVDDSMTPGRIEVPAGVFLDSLRTGNLAGGLSKPIAIDTRLPTVTVTPAAVGQPLGAGGSMPLVFTLSEPVAGFTAADVQVTGGRLVGFAGRGLRYTARFVPDAASTTPGGVVIAAGSFVDLAGNPNLAGGLGTPIAVDTRPKTLVVTRDRATIQQAVDAVADGGTVLLPHGVYDVAASPVTIVGKIVNLVGLPAAKNRASKPVVRGADTPAPVRTIEEAVGLINYGPGGGGRVENLTLEGGDAGARGYAGTGGPPQGVVFKGVSFLKNGRGLAGTFQRLEVQDSSISGAYTHGASLSFPADSATAAAVAFVNTTIGNCGAFGLRITSYRSADNPLSIVINKATIAGNMGGGVVLIGPMNVQTLESRFLDNGQVGFWGHAITTTNNLFFKGLVSGTYGVGSKPVGHGFVLSGSGSMSAAVSTFTSNFRAGVCAEGPVTVTLSGCTVTNNKVGIASAFDAQVVDVSSTITNNTSGNNVSDKELDVPGAPDIPEQ